MSAEFFLISAGAAKGLVQTVEPTWRERGGASLHADFGAVGAMKEKLLSGAPCDVLILTEPMLAELGRADVVDANTIRPLGRVFTGVAVPEGAPAPDIAAPEALGRALRSATAIYFPDPERATAGIHFAHVLRTLHLADELAPRLRTFPNGAAAMRAMADARDRAAIGCTQVTEIRYTPGVTFVGPLPKAFELSTVYAAAVCRRARDPGAAERFVAALTGNDTVALRRGGGFEALA